MTKRKIAKRISQLTGYSACYVDVDLICFDAKVRPFDIECLNLIHGHLVLYLKGSWTVHGDNTRVQLDSISSYIDW